MSTFHVSCTLFVACIFLAVNHFMVYQIHKTPLSMPSHEPTRHVSILVEHWNNSETVMQKPRVVFKSSLADHWNYSEMATPMPTPQVHTVINNAVTLEQRYAQHLQDVLVGCEEICDLSLEGLPSLFFNFIKKRVDCLALGKNAAIDAQGFEDPPPREIPQAMMHAFTFDGKITPGQAYYHEKYLGAKANVPVWTRELVDEMVKKAKQRELDGNYGRSDTNSILDALAIMDVSGGHALVIGSENPWVEACVLSMGAAHVTTLEYGEIRSEHPQISTLRPHDMRDSFQDMLDKFDLVVTFSSVEHSGLGRYGDALNPFGDKQIMARAWCMAKPGARMLLGVPSWGDGLEFNAHRVYGPLQYPHLLANWEQVWRAPDGSQRVHVMKKPTTQLATIWVGARLEGQLGNNLFTAASSFGIARARGASWCIKGLSGSLLESAVVFRVPVTECPPVPFQEEMEGRFNQRFVSSMMEGSGKGNTLVGTYLQAWPYFAVSGVPFELRAKDWGRQWVTERGLNVAIHVRGPDYGLRASESFYVKAIERLRNLTQGEELRFVVTTDDLDWVKSKRVFDGMIISQGHTPSQDMAINAACRHMIMSLGTFGWWGAFLNKQEGLVIYWIVPFNWDESFERYSVGHNSTEFYMSSWIPIKADKD